MNSNIKRVDNTVGKHKNFRMVSDKTHDLLRSDGAAHRVYLELWRQSDGSFNATVKSLAKLLHMTEKTVAAALERLQGEYRLLIVVAEKTQSGKGQRRTKKGYIIPNTAKTYYIHYEPFAEVAEQQRPAAAAVEQSNYNAYTGTSSDDESTPFDDNIPDEVYAADTQQASMDEFSADEIYAAIGEQAPAEQQSSASAAERRQKEIDAICEKYALYSSKQKQRVYDQLIEYKRQHGKVADGWTTNRVAEQISINSSYTVAGDERLKQ